LSLEISTRPFVLSDLSRVIELENASFEIDAFSETTFTGYYHKHPRFFVVAETAGVIVGYMIAYPISAEQGLVVSIAVDPTYRRKGVGKILAGIAIDRLKEFGMKQIELRVRIINVEGYHFWKGLGFVVDKAIPNFYSDGGEALQMVKRVSETSSYVRFSAESSPDMGDKDLYTPVSGQANELSDTLIKELGDV